MIPAGQDNIYSQIKTLEDFKALGKVGAFGENWFDIKVWIENNLPYTVVDGEWRNIYDMLAKGDRGIDYFSRGFNEVVVEAEAHPDLEIESHLMFIYDRDFRFYLSQPNAELKDVIEDALLQAQDNGLMAELIRKYWANDFSKLNFAGRVKIELDTPE